MLVVISVILVLFGLLLPALKRAVDQARMIMCHNMLRNVGVVTHVYAQDSQGYIPNPKDYIQYMGFDAMQLDYKFLAFDYVDNTDLFFSPLDEVRRPTRKSPKGWAAAPEINYPATYTFSGFWTFYMQGDGFMNSVPLMLKSRWRVTDDPHVVIHYDQFDYWSSPEFKAFHPDKSVHVVRMDGSSQWVQWEDYISPYPSTTLDSFSYSMKRLDEF